jgi:hypothetical protein
MGTAVERHSAVTDFSKKAEGLGVPGVRADGMDVLAMREAVAEHLRIARDERRPTLVEAFTYRFRGHSAADPEVYRDRQEVEEWRKKDPIAIFRDRLLAERVVDERAIEELDARVEAEVLAAVEFADSSPEPPLDTLYDHLYVLGTQEPGWYAVDERAPTPFAGERERDRLEGEAKRLAEAGAAYGGQAASHTGRRSGDELEDREAADALEDRDQFLSEDDEEEETQGPW